VYIIPVDEYIYTRINSYRRANARLRKMGRPELRDVSSGRLKMRDAIEAEIGNVILGCGFRRVVPSSNDADGDGGALSIGRVVDDHAEVRDAITSWNRSLHLYERIV
jgi:hypothetical protein